MWKEVNVTDFKILLQCLVGDIWENQENSVKIAGLWNEMRTLYL
jgi:hypothetical protein